MVYHLVKLNLSRNHLRKMKKHLANPVDELKIKLMPNHMHGGSHPMYLTQRQVDGLVKAKTEGKGKTIKFTQALLNKNIKSRGGNIFGDIWDGVKSGARWAWDHKKEIADVGKQIYDHRNEIANAVGMLGAGRKHKRKRKRARKAVAGGIFAPGGRGIYP